MISPKRIEPRSPNEMLLAWDDGQNHIISYAELRYFCPCAACVDENTGLRTIRREAIVADVRPTKVRIVGRYAAAIEWSDRHTTGIYPFELLRELSTNHGKLAE